MLVRGCKSKTNYYYPQVCSSAICSNSAAHSWDLNNMLEHQGPCLVLNSAVRIISCIHPYLAKLLVRTSTDAGKLTLKFSLLTFWYFCFCSFLVSSRASKGKKCMWQPRGPCRIRSLTSGDSCGKLGWRLSSWRAMSTKVER